MEDVAMAGTVRRGFTAAEKTEMWDRWQRGESLKSIGRVFGKQTKELVAVGRHRGANRHKFLGLLVHVAVLFPGLGLPGFGDGRSAVPGAH